eukprot:361477-Chlamydomonas_euryale.AAC.2
MCATLAATPPGARPQVGFRSPLTKSVSGNPAAAMPATPAILGTLVTTSTSATLAATPPGTRPQVGFRSPLTKSVSGDPGRSIDGLVKDDVSGAMYVFSDESLYEVGVLQEARDMWRVYLSQVWGVGRGGECVWWWWSGVPGEYECACVVVTGDAAQCVACVPVARVRDGWCVCWGWVGRRKCCVWGGWVG